MTHKTLREMTPEEAQPILEAWRKGEPVERYFLEGGWERTSLEYHLSRTARYRIPVTQDEVPWHVFAPEVQWYARDANGECCVYDEKPRRDKNFWYVDDIYPTHAIGPGLLAGHTIGTCDWRDSLQQRPEASL